MLGLALGLLSLSLSSSEDSGTKTLGQALALGMLFTGVRDLEKRNG